MGMYTQLYFNATLSKETPKEIIDTIQRMLDPNQSDIQPENLPKGDRVSWMFRSGGSAYFGGISGLSSFKYDSLFKKWSLFGVFDIKDYDNEIESFLEWIKPHIEHGAGRRQMYAMMMYEEQSEPTIYYLHSEDN